MPPTLDSWDTKHQDDAVLESIPTDYVNNTYKFPSIKLSYIPYRSQLKLKHSESANLG